MLCFLTLIDNEEDRSKFESIYLEYRSLIYYCAEQILQNSHDAEDAAQDALVQIARHIGDFKDVRSDASRGLVILIARQKARDICRARARKGCFSLEERRDGNGQEEPDPVNRMSGIDENLVEILDQMNGRYREVLIKRICYGYDFAEIARQLSVTEVYARKLLQRARAQFIRIYEERGRGA